MKARRRPAIAKEQIMVQVSSHPRDITNMTVDSFRRFVKDIGSVRNPEYNIDISAAIPKIADYGNIQIDSTVD